ncbi:hypothetical protein FWH09_02080 [Candidatus Saccharibacteria bacterium]|nr:hypothetical protein [Candidatus Saccharibacteria bacterium]
MITFRKEVIYVSIFGNGGLFGKPDQNASQRRLRESGQGTGKQPATQNESYLQQKQRRDDENLGRLTETQKKNTKYGW